MCIESTNILLCKEFVLNQTESEAKSGADVGQTHSQLPAADIAVTQVAQIFYFVKNFFTNIFLLFGQTHSQLPAADIAVTQVILCVLRV